MFEPYGSGFEHRANGGGGGIRTLEAGLARLAAFKAAAFNRSATPPGDVVEG
jgi:hypothetical protein